MNADAWDAPARLASAPTRIGSLKDLMVSLSAAQHAGLSVLQASPAGVGRQSGAASAGANAPNRRRPAPPGAEESSRERRPALPGAPGQQWPDAIAPLGSPVLQRRPSNLAPLLEPSGPAVPTAPVSEASQEHFMQQVRNVNWRYSLWLSNPFPVSI